MEYFKKQTKNTACIKHFLSIADLCTECCKFSLGPDIPHVPWRGGWVSTSLVALQWALPAQTTLLRLRQTRHQQGALLSWLLVGWASENLWRHVHKNQGARELFKERQRKDEARKAALVGSGAKRWVPVPRGEERWVPVLRGEEGGFLCRVERKGGYLCLPATAPTAV